MRTPPMEAFPMFRSAAQTAVVALLYLRDGELTVSELAAQAGVSRVAVSKMLPALERSGILVSSSRGSSKLLRANVDAPFYSPLRSLLAITVGPPAVLADAFGQVPNIDEIWIFGSWAARASDETGRLPADVDVLVVGQPARGDVFDAARTASRALAREVNPLIVSAADWAEQSDPFLASIARGPLLSVKHEGIDDGHRLARPTGDRTDDGEWATALLPARARAKRDAS